MLSKHEIEFYESQDTKKIVDEFLGRGLKFIKLLKQDYIFAIIYHLIKQNKELNDKLNKKRWLYERGIYYYRKRKKNTKF